MGTSAHSPQAIISSKLASKCRSLEAILHETFLSISSLRDALQTLEHSAPREEATALSHTGAAQSKVISRELKKLSELKHRFRWQADNCFVDGHTPTGTPLVASDRCFSESEGPAVPRHINGAGETMASLKLELQKRDTEVRNLNSTVERLVAKNEKLERRVGKLAERLKEPGRGNGTLTTALDTTWDWLNEADLCRLSYPEGSDDGMHFAGEQQENALKKSMRRGRHDASNGGSVRNEATDSATSASQGEKLGQAMPEKQTRRRRGGAEVRVKKQGRSELSKVFDASIAEVTETVSAFSKAMVVLMKKAKWGIDEGGVEWVMESHKALAVQSYVCLQMFRGFENEDFYMTGRLSWLLDPAKHREECRQQFEAMVQMVQEPLDLLAGMAPDSAFGQFCRKKFLQIIPASMEEALLGDLRHRNCLMQEEAAHPRSRFYQAFVRVAKAVWMLHKLAFSLEPRVSIFQAQKGADFAATIMVSHISNLELASDTPNLLPKVAFTIMPGFRMGDSVLLKCRVYLNGMRLSSPANSHG